MTLRVPSSSFQLRSLLDLRRNLADTQRVQQQLATGIRVQRPSDDPIAAARVLPLQSELRALDRISSNALTARDSIDLAAFSLQQASDLLIRGRELAIQGANDTVGGIERRTLGEEVEQLLQQLLTVANTQNGGRYLFGGTSDRSAPFERVDETGGTSRVLYRGTRGQREVEVAPGVRTATNFAGSSVFFSNERTATVFDGNTGIAAGPNFDTGRGTDTLEARLTGLRFPDGTTGITLAASGGDALGPITYEFTAPDQLSLNSGPPVTIGAGEFQVPVGTGGQSLSLDITLPISPAIGTIVAEAELSIDGFQTTTQVDFREDRLVVEDSLDGSLLNVDVSSLNRAGAEAITYGGTFDAFQALIELRDALRNPNGQSDAAVRDRLQELVGAVDEAHDRVLGALQDFGARSQGLELMQNRVDTLRTNDEAALSRLRDTDIASAITELELRNVSYQAALQVTARAVQTSLLNFLR